MRVQDFRRKQLIRRFEAHIQQPTSGYSLYAQATKKTSQFCWSPVICQTARSDCFGARRSSLHFCVGNKSAVANGLQSQSFAGQDTRLRLDVIVDVHLIVVGVGALKGQDIRILAIDFNARRGDVNRLHPKRPNRYDAHDGQHKR